MTNTPALLLFLLVTAAWANDGSGEGTPAGGVQLRREARISMEKERLTIGRDKVTVEYEFLNGTSADITTLVLFPVPVYGADSEVSSGSRQPVRDFHVWVDGQEVQYQTQIEARVRGVDHSATLRKMGVDVLSFGHYVEEKADVDRLSPAQRAELLQLGLFDDHLPAWEVAITYHWQQTFPARRLVRIRHEYKPVNGLDHWGREDLIAKKGTHALPADFCIDSPLMRTLEQNVSRDNGFVEGSVEPIWVDYILTTANTWKTPIKDFELVIERPQTKGGERWYVSLCWPGKIQRLDDNTFVAREKNFVPKQELRVMFVQIGR